MFDRLEDIVKHYEELMFELNNPSVAEDQKRFRKLMKEQSDLTPLVETYKEYKQAKQDVEDSLALLEEESDEEMREMAKEELSDAKKRIEELEQQLKILLLPKDPNDDKNVIVEIRAGAGGDEAALFAVPDVRPLRRAPAVEGGADQRQRERHRRHEGSGIHDHRPGRIFQAEIRKRRTPGTACAGD